MTKQCTIIDNATGEILNENFIIDDLESQQRRKKAAKKDKLSREFKLIQSQYLGNFIFYIFKNISTLENILTDSDLVKFIYIATYVKSNGALMLDNNVNYIDKRRLKNIMNISSNVFNKFYDKLIENQLIKESENKIYINLNYFWRGEEKEYKRITNINMVDFTRIYIQTTRDLYLNTTSKNHKKLSIVYKLLPYINWKYNILAKNINETEKEKVDPLSVKEIMDILNYSNSNLTRFKKEFYSLTYNQYQIFGTFQTKAEYTTSTIYLNPLVAYRGNDIDELRTLINMFEIQPI